MVAHQPSSILGGGGRLLGEGHGFKPEILFCFVFLLRKSMLLLEKWEGVSGCELTAGNDPL